MTSSAEQTQPTGRPSPDSYLGTVLRTLWPPPATVHLAGRRGMRGVGQRFVAVPSAAAPKLLVPTRPRRAAAGAVRGFKTASTRRGHAQLRLLALGAACGGLDLLPDHVVVTAPGAGSTTRDAAGIEARLGAVFGAPIRVALYIGPARAVRKPVLQVLDGSGRTFAFAKLGVDPFTDDLVDAEAATVAMVRAAHPSTVRVPDVLHHGRWDDHALLVQSALPRGGPPSAHDPRLARAVREIASVGEVNEAPLARSSYWARLVDRVHALTHDDSTDRMRTALDRIAETHGAAPLRYGSSHGDFAPWNMTIAADRLQVWDWEKFEVDVPVGFDLVHFAVQGDVVNGGLPVETAFARTMHGASRLLAAVGNRDAARLVVRLYALDIATRYLYDREQDAGPTRMSDLATWLRPVLTDAARYG